MLKSTHLIICLSLFIYSSQSHAHDDGQHDHNTVSIKHINTFKPGIFSLADGRLQNRVSITTKNGYRYIRANNIPNHQTGNGVRGRNPHSIKEQNKTYKITLKPQFAAKPTKSFPNAFGVAVNGVFFEPSTAEFWRGDRNWNQEAINGSGKRLESSFVF